MSPATAAIGIVLAGGRSRRMAAADAAPGGKASCLLGGRTFLERVVAAMTGAVSRVWVVAAPGQLLPPLPADVEIVRDSEPGAGPLAGLRDGLAAAQARGPAAGIACVCSCDVPLVRGELLRLLVARGLAANAAWVVPVWAGHPQVLLSALAPDLLPRIEAYLATGRRDPRGLLAALEAEAPARVVRLAAADLAAADPEGDSFLDVDTAADLARLRDRGIPPSAP